MGCSTLSGSYNDVTDSLSDLAEVWAKEVAVSLYVLLKILFWMVK